jgi:hypothetical protein
MDAATLNVTSGALVLIVLCLFRSLHAYDSDDFALMEMQVDINIAFKTAQLVISTTTLFDYRLSSSLLHLSKEL